VITRVGDEHMGRFLREQLVREGVDVRGVKTDPDRLTALVILGIRDTDQFPLIFYRENCADMAIAEADIDPEFIAESGCLAATGTHLSHPSTAAAVVKALTIARGQGARTALDIDYRPNLWGLAGHGAGEARFIASGAVTERLQSTLHLLDLIVGTEEEFFIAGGASDIITALRAVRAITDAVLVCKRGPMGAAVFDGPIPDRLDDGKSGPGFPIEVFNVLGAGDGFMSGLLRGWLRDEPWERTLTYANVCGAFAVSRHGCAPAYPSWDELSWFLEHGSAHHALRMDEELEHIHWATNRRIQWPTLRVLAFDQDAQFQALATESGARPDRIAAFKQLCLAAVRQVANGAIGYGVLCDDRDGRDALYAAAGSGLWIGRPTKAPGAPPLALDPKGDPAVALAEWPIEHAVRLACHQSPGDESVLSAAQEQAIARVARAARANGLDLMLEIVTAKAGVSGDDAVERALWRCYDLGVRPDWWALEPMATDAAWERVGAVLDARDPWCRGILVLGLDTPEDVLPGSLPAAARQARVKGFAAGGAVYGNMARAWFRGEIDDEAATDGMATRFALLCDTWDRARDSERGTT
jgi:5-dehydro-2-deoxygluconokinase